MRSIRAWPGNCEGAHAMSNATTRLATGETLLIDAANDAELRQLLSLAEGIALN